eukprot:TRINITY_DN5908_c0_g2_i1.p1 TRINITY_DN5908_c0_g2~~TRINITY_DN5908_c0_g2_i1.p1  ORF type:complete len:508 (-),score=87.47 TRINITY_DN5908_c0_g2_i1:316-1809(-)
MATSTSAPDGQGYDDAPNWGGDDDTPPGDWGGSETPTSTNDICPSSGQPAPLEGSPLDVINRNALFLLAGILAVTLIGLALQKYVFKNRFARDREPLWVKCLLFVSYGYLIPGLAMKLFSFNLLLDCGPQNKFSIGPNGGFGGDDAVPGTSESMLGLIKLLHQTGGDLAAIIVIIYAMVIPALKLVLLFTAWMSSGTRARRCTQVVQNISKWACPDMFAYIFLMYLVKQLSHPPQFLAQGHTCLGFTFFTIFCVGSTVASLGIRVPDREHGCWQKAGRMLREQRLIFAVAPLCLAFVGFFVVGLNKPVMELAVGKLNGMTESLLTQLHLKEKLHAEVTIIDCVTNLLKGIERGETNDILSFLLIAFFVVVMTTADMMVLLLIAVLVKTGRFGRMWMKFAWYLKKLSMLDVTCMGILVVTLCMSMYKKDGVIVSFAPGVWYLVAAEILHYITYYLVKGTIEVTEKVDMGDPLDEDAGSAVSDSSSESEGSDDHEYGLK